MSVRIDINEVKRLQERRREINAIPLGDIVWVDGERVIEISPKVLREWIFTGLSNVDFIDMDVYLDTEFAVAVDG